MCAFCGPGSIDVIGRQAFDVHISRPSHVDPSG